VIVKAFFVTYFLPSIMVGEMWWLSGEMWWLSGRCGGSGGDVVAHGEMWWLSWGDVVAQLGRCGGSVG
jgi:hypothetical protein